MVEAVEKDEGQDVTKAVDDNLKICKLIKDMQDFIRGKAARNVRREIIRDSYFWSKGIIVNTHRPVK